MTQHIPDRELNPAAVVIMGSSYYLQHKLIELQPNNTGYMLLL